MKKLSVPGLLEIPLGTRLPEVGGACFVITREKVTLTTWKWYLHVITPPSGVVSRVFPVPPDLYNRLSIEVIGSRLWLFGQLRADIGGGALIEYDLATLTQTRKFDVMAGDKTFRGGPLAELQTGEVAATWYKHVTGQILHYGIGIVRNNAVAAIGVDLNAVTGSTIPSSKMAMVQHPTSKVLWQFSRRDGGSAIQAISINPATLQVLKADNAFITTTTQDQVHAPEVEFPSLFAVENASSGIDLIYGNRNGIYVSKTPPVKKYTFPSIMRMVIPDKRSYTFVPVSVERISSVALLRDSSGRYAVVQCNQDRTAVVATRGQPGVWDTTVTLGTGTANFAVGPKTQVVALYRSETSTEIITEPFVA